MKNLPAVRHGKNKNKITLFKLSILLPLLLVAVFLSDKTALADSHLIINEIQITGGTGKTTNDFIEIYNPTNSKINLNGYRLVKRTKTGTSDTSIKSWTSDTFIKSNDYYLWANSSDGFAESIKADAYTSETIAADNGIALRKGDKDMGEIIDSVGWGECQNIFIESLAYPTNPGANKSIERKIFQDTNNNSEDFAILETPTPTHGQPEPISNNSQGEQKTIDYSGKVIINEIYPAPKTALGEEEFIEIVNASDQAIDFSDWTIKDEKGNKPSISKREENGPFYIFYGSFSLNNDSKGDTVFLYDNQNNLVDSQKYQSTKSGYAYAFDGAAWRWTSQPTPRETNKFDKILSGKISKDKTVYASMYANFTVEADKDAKKITWDFGDGHKSYMEATRHKYEKPGQYEASLKITGDGEDKLYNFTVEVEKYDAPKIRIASFSPNPKGNDTKNEYIILENNSKKKINLKGWSIATGWDKLINHPVREDFIIKPDKTKKLTRGLSTFTLNNEKTKIELRSPDGKVVQKIKYDRKKDKIKEDELYQKNASGWEWIKPEEKTVAAETVPAENEIKTIEKVEENELASLNVESPADLTDKIETEASPDLQENQPQVLGTEKIRNERNWLGKLAEAFWNKMNFGINMLLLKFI